MHPFFTAWLFSVQALKLHNYSYLFFIPYTDITEDVLYIIYLVVFQLEQLFFYSSSNRTFVSTALVC